MFVSFFFHLFLDQTYGDLTDYVYDKLNVTHSYGLELRPGDDEPNGFLLSSCEIIPTGREIMAALKAIMPILERENHAGVQVEGEEKQKKEEKKRENGRRSSSRRSEKRRDATKGKGTKRDQTRRVKTRKRESKQKGFDKIELIKTGRDKRQDGRDWTRGNMIILMEKRRQKTGRDQTRTTRYQRDLTRLN